MKNKKFLLDYLIIIFALILFFVWYHSNYKDTTTTMNNLGSYRIYLITMDKMDEYWNHVDRGAADMARLLGVTYRWEAPEKKNTQQQIDILNRVVEDGADAILIAANDPVLISGAIEDAKAKAVKIIYVDSPAYEEAITTLATDNRLAGITAAKAMLAELEELRINNGLIGIIGVNMNTDSTMKREAGFRETILEDGRFTLLETAYRNGESIGSEVAAADFILENENLVGIFGTNEGSTEGVGNAISKNNKKIIGIGFDQSRAILRQVRDGSLKAVMVQNPYTMGYLGMAEAVAALRGFETGPPYIDTGVSVMTSIRRD